MHKNEIVFTKRLFDVGLCVGEDNGVPIIHGKYSQYSDSIYGGVQLIDWLASGVYCTKYEWDQKTKAGMTVKDIMDAFGITERNLTKTPCRIEGEGWDDMSVLTSFLSDCEYVKRGCGVELANQLMSRFSIRNKNTFNRRFK